MPIPLNLATMQHRRFSPLSLLFWIGLAYVPATTGIFFGPDRWYHRLTKPDWTPPDAVFGPVWTALYASMGLSIYLVARKDKHPLVPWAIALFLLNLMLNAAWSPLFFGLHRPDLSLVCIGVQWFALVSMIRAFWRVRPAAGMLQVPHLLWLTFAFALNAAIWHLNR
ncbi:TspO/MBR family protein [Nannocystis bainbridge]|nr:TspO/MBR family protein [Nannocystis bainbridge]